MTNEALWEALGGINDRHVLDALPPSYRAGYVPEKRPSAMSRFLSNGWVAAGLSVVVALGVLTAIVLAGRHGGPSAPPAGTAEPESEGLPVWVETTPESETEAITDSETEAITDSETVSETESPGLLEVVTEEEYDAPRPDPVLNPLSSTCQVNVSFSDASVKLTQAYIYDGDLTISSGLSDVTDTDYVYSGTGAPIDGNYLRVLSEDPYLPTVCTADPASNKIRFQAGGWRPASSSYVIYNADFQRLGALMDDLVDGVYYVVIYANTNRSAPGTHKIGGWELTGIARYNIPFRLVVGDVDFTPPAYPAEEKLHAPFDGLAVTTNRATTVIDEGYLCQAALTDESGQTALGVDFPAISYQLARTLAYYDKTITVSADTAASVVLSPVKTDADSVIINIDIYDRACTLTDAEITELSDGIYYVLVDMELEGGSFTVDGQTYTGGTARYQVVFELRIGTYAS